MVPRPGPPDALSRSKTLRVAIVAPLVTPVREAQAFGAHAIVLDLARGLAARGHEVTIHGREGSYAAELTLRTVDPGPSVPAKAATGPWHPGSAAMRHAFEEVFARIRADAPDAVSQHAFDADPVELGEGLPVLHTLHLPPLAPPVVAAVRRVRPAAVTVSRSARAAWAAAGVDIEVIPNGVADVDVGAPAVERTALVPGRVSPEKGTAAAIRVARAAGLEPVVVGEVDDERYFEREVRPLLPDGPRPALTRPELRRLMARSAVLLMPVEWDEPFGLVAAEAQLAGCPVVAYRRGALPEVVADGVGGILVAPGSEAALVAAVPRALSLDRAAVRASARERFSLERMVDAYERRLAGLSRLR